jgi:uncharacterized membrane protein
LPDIEQTKMLIERIFLKPNTQTQSLGKDKISRSFIKSVSWRIIGTIDTILISYFVTGKIDFALSIGMIELITKMGLYVVHERVWNRFSWGKTKK